MSNHQQLKELAALDLQRKDLEKDVTELQSKLWLEEEAYDDQLIQEFSKEYYENLTKLGELEHLLDIVEEKIDDINSELDAYNSKHYGFDDE